MDRLSKLKQLEHIFLKQLVYLFVHLSTFLSINCVELLMFFIQKSTSSQTSNLHRSITNGSQMEDIKPRG